jgi:hypothetical protein
MRPGEQTGPRFHVLEVGYAKKGIRHLPGAGGMCMAGGVRPPYSIQGYGKNRYMDSETSSGSTDQVPASPGQPDTCLFCYEEKAGRIELLVRIFYSIAIAIVLFVYSFIASICMFIQFFVILVLGRRNRGLAEFVQGYCEYQVHVLSYVSFLTDRRPGIMPVPVRIIEERR